MSNLFAKHHHSEERAHKPKLTPPVDLIHVPVSVDHYKLIPQREARQVFDSEDRLVESVDVKKKIQTGDLRLERHTGAGAVSGRVRAPPKKGGHGGKYTWEGLYSSREQEEAPAAIDENDPNFDDDVAQKKVTKRRKPKKKKSQPGKESETTPEQAQPGAEREETPGQSQPETEGEEIPLGLSEPGAERESTPFGAVSARR
jgi:hypothetical protein